MSENDAAARPFACVKSEYQNKQEIQYNCETRYQLSCLHLTDVVIVMAIGTNSPLEYDIDLPSPPISPVLHPCWSSSRTSSTTPSFSPPPSDGEDFEDGDSRLSTSESTPEPSISEPSPVTKDHKAVDPMPSQVSSLSETLSLRSS